MPDQMDDAGLDSRFREGGGDRLREAFQPVHDGDQDVLDPSVAQLVHHRQPELGTFIIGDPEAEDLALPLPGDAQGDVNSPSPAVLDRWRHAGSIFTIRLSASRIFTRKASKITMGYIRSSARCCQSRTSSSTASVTRLIRSGETLRP
jgi:hypothetical protein